MPKLHSWGLPEPATVPGDAEGSRSPPTPCLQPHEPTIRTPFSLPRPHHRFAVLISGCLLALVTIETGVAQQPLQFGGAYAGLGERRQRLVDDWLARLEKTTGQKLEPAAFYDEILAVSSKTTFDAVTHALMTTPLTDATGAKLGAAGYARAD